MLRSFISCHDLRVSVLQFMYNSVQVGTTRYNSALDVYMSGLPQSDSIIPDARSLSILGTSLVGSQGTSWFA
jgi:hypothetical protein